MRFYAEMIDIRGLKLGLPHSEKGLNEMHISDNLTSLDPVGSGSQPVSGVVGRHPESRGVTTYPLHRRPQLLLPSPAWLSFPGHRRPGSSSLALYLVLC